MSIKIVRLIIMLLQLYQSVKIVRNKTFKLVVVRKLYSEQFMTDSKNIKLYKPELADYLCSQLILFIT